MLRLRASPELRLAGAHGRLAADREHESLWRLAACGPEDAFAFDLERTPRRASGSPPAVQLVLQYSMLVPAPVPAAAAGGGAAPGSRCAAGCRLGGSAGGVAAWWRWPACAAGMLRHCNQPPC